VGDLVLVYKRVTALAGHTSRVSELLEAVARMSASNASSYHREVTRLARRRGSRGTCTPTHVCCTLCQLG
jgi:hypothetical protein